MNESMIKFIVTAIYVIVPIWMIYKVIKGILTRISNRKIDSPENIDEADTVWARRRRREKISWEISPSSDGTIQMKSGKKVTKRTLRIIMVFCVLMIIFSICTMDSDGIWMSIGICVPMLLMCIAGYDNTYEGKGTDPEDMDEYSGYDG